MADQNSFTRILSEVRLCESFKELGLWKSSGGRKKKKKKEYISNDAFHCYLRRHAELGSTETFKRTCLITDVKSFFPVDDVGMWWTPGHPTTLDVYRRSLYDYDLSTMWREISQPRTRWFMKCVHSTIEREQADICSYGGPVEARSNSWWSQQSGQETFETTKIKIPSTSIEIN